MNRTFVLLWIAAVVAAPVRADDSKPNSSLKSKPSAALAEQISALVKFVNAEGKPTWQESTQALSPIQQQLAAKETASQTADALLDRKAEFKFGPAAEKRFAALAAEKKNVAAAELLLQCVKAQSTVKQFGKGGVVIGQVVVADGKLQPDLVLAQMPISETGWFAGEVGDLSKSIGFRAAGYEEVNLPLAGKPGEVFDAGTVTMKPLPTDKAASLKGKVDLEIPDRRPVKASLSLGVPRPNTPHNGYSPRRRWPQPPALTVEKDGSFTATGLTPGDYYLSVEAKDHANFATQVKLEPGKETVQKPVKLRTTDLGFYIGKTAPKSGELPWEKDVQAAFKRAAAEKKPLMVMTTATWCGWCKKLEKDTLSDPWVKHFLSDVVIVKAYEDKELEKKYQANDGYPTLLFIDSDGKEVHRIVGYKESIPFLSQCVMAFNKLAKKLPDELQVLVDKKVVAAK